MKQAIKRVNPTLKMDVDAADKAVEGDGNLDAMKKQFEQFQQKAKASLCWKCRKRLLPRPNLREKKPNNAPTSLKNSTLMNYSFS